MKPVLCFIKMLEPINPALLADMLVKITNRFVLAVRNIGIVAYASPFLLSKGSEESRLREWRVEKSLDGRTWEHVYQPNALLEALSHIQMPRDYLNISNWPFIEEAILENAEPSPENEFLVNALEHLRKENRRIALLEAIVCLELVLTQFLRAYLQEEKGFPAKSIKDVINANLHLSTRVKLVLPLVMSNEERNSFDFEKVATAIKWRNEVVHQTGHLPPNVPRERLTDVIAAVLSLCLMLGQRRDHLVAAPELSELAQKLGQIHNIAAPTIQVGRSHRLSVRCDLLTALSKDELNTIRENFIKLRLEKDQLFKSERHLLMAFYIQSKLFAFWAEGCWHGPFFSQKKPGLPSPIQ